MLGGLQGRIDDTFTLVVDRDYANESPGAAHPLEELGWNGFVAMRNELQDAASRVELHPNGKPLTRSTGVGSGGDRR
jgi:hypothetical protein